jgi:hypothetical protein
MAVAAELEPMSPMALTAWGYFERRAQHLGDRRELGRVYGRLLGTVEQREPADDGEIVSGDVLGLAGHRAR